MNRVKEYFNFSRRERNGIIALIILLLFILFLPEILPQHPAFNKEEMEIFKKEIVEFMKGSDSANEYEMDHPVEQNFTKMESLQSHNVKMFEFDPNQLSAQGWQQLGISERTIQTIEKYLSHGGKFKKADDLKKIYGLRPSDLKRLLPYVKISESVLNKDSFAIARDNLPRINLHKQWPGSKIDLNKADSSALASLPGIGEKLASRIIKYRDKLGGFYSSDQLAEIYGLNDTLVQNLKTHSICSAELIRKIELNVADFEILKSHPYIRYQLARAIMQYRKQHGAITKPSDLDGLTLDALNINKLLPYISFSALKGSP